MAEETQNQENIENQEVKTETVEPLAEETQSETTLEKPEEPIIEEPKQIEEPGIVEARLKKNLPQIRQGDTVKVYQKIKETKDNKTKERIQVFEGQVLAMKHGKGITGTITVRKVVGGIGVEKIFPIHSPIIEKIEIIKQAKVRRAKLYYLREAKGRKAKLKTANRSEEIEESEEATVEE